MPQGWRDDPRIFVAIAPDGTVTVTCHRQEMGQGVRTSVAMVVADELDADWSKVRVAQAPGDEARYGNQDTDGSRSLRHFFMPLRRVGAAARTMLEQAAAQQWGVPVSEVKAADHAVVHAATRRTLGYGALAAAAAALPVPARETLKLKDPSSFRYIGTDKIGLIDNRDITTGKAIYGIDARAEGMLHAVVARPPVFGGKVKSVDDAEALKVPGVVKVVRIDPPPIPSEFQPLGGVAVVARNTWAAMQGRDKLKIVWDDGPHAAYSSDTYRAELESAARKPGKVVREQGDVNAAMAKAAKRVEAEYYIPHLAHATDGAACRARAHQGRQVRGLGLRAGAADDAHAARGAPRAEGGERHRQRDASRRRLRPQVETRLRDRGRAPQPGDGRRAREGHLDARGRPASRLLSHGLGGAARGRPRRQGPACRLAAPQRRADHRLDLRSRSEARAAVRARHGARQHALRDPELPGREPGGRRRMRASAGSARCRTSRTPSRSSPSWPSSRMRPGATRRTTCSS